MLGYLRSGSKQTKFIWWLITIAIVVTFVIGFNFYGMLGGQNNRTAVQTGTYGTINGEKVSQSMWQGAYDAQLSRFRQQFGTDPVDRDLRALQQQAWRTLVNDRLLAQAGTKAGIVVTDADVVFGMKSDPPSAVLTAPDFQTNGKFDPNKYFAALSNPNIQWAPLEAQVRTDAPASRLRERLVASIKLSESELREEFRNRYERMAAIVVQVPPADSGTSTGSDAELQRTFEKYRSLLAGPARTQLEVLTLPIHFSDDEVKVGMDTADRLYRRIVAGESFVQVCKDNSEGANAENGGLLDRAVSPAEMGPIGQVLASRKPGDVLPPMREGSMVLIFHVLDPARDSVAKDTPAGQYRLGQITIRLHASAESLRKQFDDAQNLAHRAAAVGLGRAASEKGVATSRTPFFDLDHVPPQLYGAPEAADWGVGHKKGEISPVFQNSDEFVIASVAGQYAAGVPARDDVADQLKPLADADHRVELSKARADQVASALHGGMKLEDAAKAAGLAPMPLMLTRAQPDPRLGRTPEVQGALWGARPGQVVGPIRTLYGWWFGRVESVMMPPDTLWNNEQTKGQITQDILRRRQESFLTGMLSTLRSKAKVNDMRSAFGL